MIQSMVGRVRSAPQWCKVLLLVLLARVFAAQFITPYNILSDSASYVQFPFEDLFALQLNGRTPVYPIIIRICYIVFGEVHFYSAIVAIQSIVSCISVAVFYQTLCLVFKHQRICFWAAVFYGACPSIYGWDSCILTESFALSGTVFFLYFIVRYIKTPRFAFGCASVFLMFVLTFLRPSFLLFDGLIFVFWVARWIFMKDERKLAALLCVCSMAVFAFIGGYMVLFYQTFGYYSISDPMPRQSLIINIERSYYEYSTDEAYKADVLAALEANYWDAWYAAGDILEVYTEPEIIAITDEYINAYPLAYARDTFVVMGELAEEKFKNYYEYNVNAWLYGLLPVYQVYEIVFATLRIGHLYVIMCAELIIAFVLWIKQKKIPWIHLGLAAFLCGIVLSSIVATCDEYPRTMVCALPLAYFSCASFASWVWTRALRTSTEEQQKEIEG